MAKMANLAAEAGPTEQTNAAAEAPVYKSTASLHSEDMKKMGMQSLGAGEHVHGKIHGIVSHSHEGGMTLHIAEGNLKKVGKSAVEKMYGGKSDNDADD